MSTNQLPPLRKTRSRIYPWYDSVWLTRYTHARAIIESLRPQALASFTRAFDVLRTRENFEVKLVDRVFADEVRSEILRVMNALPLTEHELHEARTFGRFIVRNHPFFTELQHTIETLVSDIVGEPVETRYNFLSRYSGRGVCSPHMDSPEAKWTLDLCLDQSDVWPIFLSQVVPWPESGPQWSTPAWEQALKDSPRLRFTRHDMRPGQALVFSGSSQWHYREAIPGASQRAFCDLLFFHFIPRGTADLLRPERWGQLFEIPQIALERLDEANASVSV